jgi:hypothetical protein
MAKRPADRYASVTDFAAELARAISGEAGLERPTEELWVYARATASAPGDRGLEHIDRALAAITAALDRAGLAIALDLGDAVVATGPGNDRDRDDESPSSAHSRTAGSSVSSLNAATSSPSS